MEDGAIPGLVLESADGEYRTYTFNSHAERDAVKDQIAPLIIKMKN